MGASAIEWTDEVWNPVTGCDRVSPGCAHCYALELAPRLRTMHQARGAGKWIDAPDGGKSSGPAFGVKLHPGVLDQPLRWRKPRKVFVNSMSDLFHDEVPEEFIAQAFTVMRRASQHTFQILTKRPERMRDVVSRMAWRVPTTDERNSATLPLWCRLGWQAYMLSEPLGPRLEAWIHEKGTAPVPADLLPSYVLPNVWLGVSIENRQFVGRADVLRATPAAVRFISAEPLLGPLVEREDYCPRGGDTCGATCDVCRGVQECFTGLDLGGIDWLIVGGESGPKHRRIDEQWVTDLRDAARWWGTAFFFKQWGGRTPKAGGRELDGQTWDEFPRQIAAGATAVAS